MKPLNRSCQNRKAFSESAEPLSRICDPNMKQNEHVYATCCRPEVAGGVISGENVKKYRGLCCVINSEVASFSTFRDISTIALSENTFAFRLKIGFLAH